MTREQLLESALQLKQPTEESAKAFEANMDALSAELIKRMSARADLDELIGGQRELMETNSRNFPAYMASQFSNYSAESLVETSIWAFRVYRAHGFHVAYWPANLDQVIEILRLQLQPSAFAEVRPFFEWLRVNVPVLAALSEQELVEEKQFPD